MSKKLSELSLDELSDFIGREVDIVNCIDWGNIPKRTTIITVARNINVLAPSKQLIENSHQVVANAFIVYREEKHWYVHPDCVVLVNNKQITLYPKKCKVCNALGRKIGNIIFCSNARCKSRSKFKYLQKNAKVSPIPVKGDVLCLICKTPAVISSIMNMHLYSGGISRLLRCINKHEWKHIMSDGDIIRHSFINPIVPDCIWSHNQLELLIK